MTDSILTMFIMAGFWFFVSWVMRVCYDPPGGVKRSEWRTPDIVQNISVTTLFIALFAYGFRSFLGWVQ